MSPVVGGIVMTFSPREWIAAAIYHLVTICIATAFVLPLFWVLSQSLRTVGLPPPPSIEWWPQPLAWHNYVAIFRIVPLFSYLQSSLIVGLLGVAITLFTSSTAAFAMAQMPNRIRQWLLFLAVLLMMAPSTGMWLARFVIFKQLWLIDTYGALVAPAMMGTSSSFVLLFYWSLRRIPAELFESARLDGATAWRIWWQLGIPLTRPTIVAVAILTFVHYWSDFVDPLLYLKSEHLYTLAIGLRILQQLDVTNWPLLMAGATVMTVPVLLGYFLVQKYGWAEDRLAGLAR